MCVCFDARFARREQASGGSGTRRRMERRDRFALAKQTRVETAGVAGPRRARETGKPGRQVRRRGKAAWPHARRTAGPFSPVTREAEQVRPLGIASGVQLIGEHVGADFEILSLKVNSADKPALCRCSYCSRSICSQSRRWLFGRAAYFTEAYVQTD